ncbi:MAG: penicillin-binding protein [Bacillota bacterium]|nr:penicillin-binding protein [Bacillota bacterium]
MKRKKRLTRMMMIMFLIWALAIANVLFVMVTKTHFWSGQSVLDSRIQSSYISQTVRAKRGTIYERNNHALAQERKSYTIIAYTKYFYSPEGKALDPDTANYYDNPEETARLLSSVLNINEEYVAYLLQNAIDDQLKQTELGNGTKQITEEQMEEIKTMDIRGIDFIKDSSRYYTISPFASNLIGYASYDIESQTFEGKLGLEKQLDGKLSGENGELRYQQTRNGHLIPGTVKVKKQAVDGYNVNLTLDWNLQSVVENALQNTMEENNAESAWCIVMECDTGKILAWSSYPSYDQNHIEEIPSYLNPLSEKSYELGSVVKPFTYAIAIDTGVYPNNKKFKSYEFWYKVENDKIVRIEEEEGTVYKPIGDALDEDFGEITFDEGFALSSNVGICELLTDYVKYEDFVQYMKEFGFYKKVNMNYVKDVKGTTNLRNKFSADLATDYLSTGFGQSTSMTPLQLVQAYTAIFNDGLMMKPYVVESIVDAKTGEALESYKPEVVATPIKKKTAQQVCELMKTVGEEGGTGTRFAIDGIDMILKTGTAQIFDSEIKSYREDCYTNSVIAAAPSTNPKIMVYYGLQSSNYYYDASHFKEILITALNCNTIDASDPKKQEEKTLLNKTYEVENYINHSLQYVKKKLEEYSNYLVIGDGDTIINQYPLPGTTILDTEVIFLLSDGNHYTMPDMTDWTMKEISAFWNMTGISISTEGEGRVFEQNIAPGSILSKEDSIIVYLQ